MPWFPDFVNAAELARKQTRAAVQADPVGQYIWTHVPGHAVRMPFTAYIAGRFEVELHPTDALLAVVEVKP